MKMWLIIVFFVASIIISGCGDNCDIILEENKTLRGANIELAREIVDLKGQNQDLQARIINLDSIDPAVRLENIITVKNIEIARRTGFYDKNRDGRDNQLIVYLKTIDEYGDAVKGSGQVDVELWDLETDDSENAKLAQWTFTAKQLKSEWATTMISNFYRLVFDISSLDIKYNQNITVKIKFTDYLTGRIFQEQVVVTSSTPPLSSKVRRVPTAAGSMISLGSSK